MLYYLNVKGVVSSAPPDRRLCSINSYNVNFIFQVMVIVYFNDIPNYSLQKYTVRVLYYLNIKGVVSYSPPDRRLCSIHSYNIYLILQVVVVIYFIDINT